MGKQVAYSLNFKPIILKRLVLECGFTQAQFAAGALAGAGGESLINLIINRNYAPPRIPDYRKRIEQYVGSNLQALSWLKANNLGVKDIWQPLGREMRGKGNSNKGRRCADSRGLRAMLPGDANNNEFNQEVDVLTAEAMKHFKVFRNPFINDIRDVQDIYLSDEHRYIKEVMLDAARNQGFVAVVGEVGSGKSAIRKYVVEELGKDESVRIIFPRMIDKTRVTAASLCDAIIMDLSDESPKNKLEQKSRQVEHLLISRLKAGARAVLMIEEAHDLTVRVLKLLKRIYEIEHGYKKACGIILIGQPELGSLFNENDHYEMREVIRRCQIAYIRGLNGNIKDYLLHKFKRAGVEISKIIDDKAIDMISKRLTDIDDRKRKISNAYPLTVNNLIIRAMNEAYDMGYSIITEQVIQAV